MRISIGVTVGLVVFIVQVTGLAIWLTTLTDGIDSVSRVGLSLRQRMSTSVSDLLIERLLAGEKTTNTSARYFRKGIYVSPDRPDARGVEVNRTLDMMRSGLYASRDVTTFSWTDYYGNLFGMYNDAFLTFFGRWESYINPATGNGVLVDMEVKGKDTPNEGAIDHVLYEQEPYNSSEQVWYTVIDFSKPESDAWTPIYYMGVGSAQVSIMLSHSRKAYYPNGKTMGVVSIDMAMGFISRILQDNLNELKLFGFVVDALYPDGCLIGVSDPSQPLLLCSNVSSSGACLVSPDFIPPSKADHPLVKKVHNYVAATYKSWSSFTTESMQTQLGDHFVAITALRRNKLEWRVVVMTPRSLIMQQLDENVLRIVIVVVVMSVVQLAVCVWLGLTIRGKFLAIGLELKRLERLEVLDDEQFAEDKRSHFSEVAELEASNHQLNSQLRQIKAYVPQSVQEQLLAAASGEDGDKELLRKDDDEGELDLRSRRSSRRGSKASVTQSASGRRSKVGSARGSVFAGETAMIQVDHTATGLNQRHVTIVSVNIRGFHQQAAAFTLSDVTTQSRKLVEDITEIITPLRGVVDFFQGDHFVISFNAVTISPAHMQNGIFTALRLVQHPDLQYSCGVASSRCLVGNCGSADVRRFNIIGPAYTQAVTLERMTRMFNVRALAPMGLLQANSMHVEYELLDMVMLPHATAPSAVGTLLCERSHEDQTGEWMYVETDGTLNSVFIAAHRGDPKAVLARMTAIMPENVKGLVPEDPALASTLATVIEEHLVPASPTQRLQKRTILKMLRAPIQNGKSSFVDDLVLYYPRCVLGRTPDFDDDLGLPTPAATSLPVPAAPSALMLPPS